MGVSPNCFLTAFSKAIALHYETLSIKPRVVDGEKGIYSSGLRLEGVG